MTHPGDVVQILEPQLQVWLAAPIDDQVEEWLRLRAPAVGRRTLRSGFRCQPTLDTLPDDPELSIRRRPRHVGRTLLRPAWLPVVRTARRSLRRNVPWMAIDKVTLRIMPTADPAQCSPTGP